MQPHHIIEIYKLEDRKRHQKSNINLRRYFPNFIHVLLFTLHIYKKMENSISNWHQYPIFINISAYSYYITESSICSCFPFPVTPLAPIPFPIPLCATKVMVFYSIKLPDLTSDETKLCLREVVGNLISVYPFFDLQKYFYCCFFQTDNILLFYIIHL